MHFRRRIKLLYKKSRLIPTKYYFVGAVLLVMAAYMAAFRPQTLVYSYSGVTAVDRPQIGSGDEVVMERLMDLQELPKVLRSVAMPKIDQPQWYKDQVAAEQRAAAESTRSGDGRGRVFTYTVKTDGSSSSVAEFSALANQTLNDPRGWAKLGVSFQEVPSGGQFNLILAAAERVPTYAPGACSAEWSCRVGVSVIINETRWNGATPAWNAAGGGLRDYRHMVINHEVGHWLGHGHLQCGGAGQLAPVMQQQSMDLQGCKFNPWPLAGELWLGR